MRKGNLHLSTLWPAVTARARDQHGYTLAELLVSVLVGLGMLATVFSFNRFQLFALRTQSRQLELQSIGRSITDLITREVRRAGMDPTCAKTFEGIAEARNDRLRIKSDLNGNGVIDGANEDVTYSLQYWPQSIQRTAGGSTELLGGNNINLYPWFEYYDGAGALIASGTSLTAAQRTAVRRVRIALWLWAPDFDPRSPEWHLASFASTIDLRNRFFVNSTACP